MKEQIINIRYIDKGKLVAILRGRFPAPNEFQISVSPESLAQLHLLQCQLPVRLEAPEPPRPRLCHTEKSDWTCAARLWFFPCSSFLLYTLLRRPLVKIAPG